MACFRGFEFNGWGWRFSEVMLQQSCLHCECSLHDGGGSRERRLHWECSLLPILQRSLTSFHTPFLSHLATRVNAAGRGLPQVEVPRLLAAAIWNHAFSQGHRRFVTQHRFPLWGMCLRNGRRRGSGRELATPRTPAARSPLILLAETTAARRLVREAGGCILGMGSVAALRFGLRNG
jgi:hypothetical protein